MSQIRLLADTNLVRNMMSFIRVSWNSDEMFLGTPIVAFITNILTLVTITIILCVLAIYRGEGTGHHWWLVLDAVRGVIPIIIRTHYIAELSIMQDILEEYRKYILFICNVFGIFWCSVIWKVYTWNAPLAFSNTSLVICVIHAFSTIPSLKIAYSLVRGQEVDGNNGHYEELTQYRAPEIISPEISIGDQAYAQNLQDQYVRIDQDRAYEELLVQRAKEQSLQSEPSKARDSPISTELPVLSPLKPEATEGRPIKVRVRNMDGNMKTRNFQPKSKLADIYKWLLKTEGKLPEFQLATSYPRAVWKSDDITVEDTGIIRNPNSEFDLSQIFAMEEKTEVESQTGSKVEDVKREEG